MPIRCGHGEANGSIGKRASEFFLTLPQRFINPLEFGDVCSDNGDSLGGWKDRHPIPCRCIFAAQFKPFDFPLLHCRAEIFSKNGSQVFWEHLPDIVPNEISRFFSY